MTEGRYDIGDKAVLSAAFVRTDGDDFVQGDATVTCRVRLPDGTAAAVSASFVAAVDRTPDEIALAADALEEAGITNEDAVGTYRGKTATIAQSGKWAYRFESTGNPAGAEEGTFVVRPRMVPAP